MSDFLTVREAAKAILRGDRLVDADGQLTSLILDDGNLNDCSYARIAPRTIQIGGMEVPEPCRTAPDMGTRYHYVSFDQGDFVYDLLWENLKTDHSRLKSGMCHLTKEAAIAHAKALIKVSGGEV